MREKQTYIETGEGKVVDEKCVIGSLGVGSCIAICLYDKKAKIAGMAHILLGEAPHKKIAHLNPMRFADTAVELLLNAMEEKGSDRKNIVAKIFGGANMFKTERLHVGEDNITAVKRELKKAGIRIVAEDTGGMHGRNIWFDTENGKVVVGTIFGPTKEF